MKKAKFRAWDGFRMTTSGIQFNSTTGELEFAPDGVLLEYIGLKDKNEAEVYQGDIVKDPFSGMTWKVSWHEKGCWYLETTKPDCEHWASISIEHIDDFEIIGNEYPNPELLEE